ncbi:MAG: AMP-binding protein, partial [Muribaculaceae bacterium]
MHSFNTIILSQLISFCNSNHNSFYINEKYYSYKDLALSVSKIRKVLKEKSIMNMHVGLVSNNDIETYAAIIALWLEGDAYIPLHPEMPIERCDDIIEQVEIKYIIDSSAQSRFTNEEIIAPALLQDSYLDLELNEDISDDKFAYILFTSGSTGQPKGVPISRKNVLAFVESFWALGYELSAKDRCLQAFDLTFDLSVISYLIPLLKGACVYPVPYDCIKYAYIAELLEDEELTFALMVPSTIRFLRAYFDEINAPSLKYNLFCGEALPAPLLKEWSRCIPNAFIDNVYGPTENTIFCTRYRYSREHDNKTYNDILSIGKSMNNTSMTLFDDNCNEIIINADGNSLNIKYNAGMSLDKSWDLTKAECIMTKIGACSNEKKHLEVGDEFCRVGMTTINAVSEKCELTTIYNNQKAQFIFEKGYTVFKEIVETEIVEESTTINFEISKEVFGDFTFELNDLQLKINS